MTATKKQQGFTIIELMVALAVGLVTIISVIKIYTDGSRLYRFNEGLAEVQENGRFALEFIRRDARNAGFWGCTNQSRLNQEAAISINFANAHVGSEISGIMPSVMADTDIVTFRGASGVGIPLSIAMTSPEDPLNLSKPANFEVGDYLVISDCLSRDIFTSAGSGKTITHRDVLSKNYGKDSAVYQAKQTTYWVGVNESNEPALFRRINNGNNEEIVNGVEAMLILFGEDTDADSMGNNGDGTANRYVPSSTKELYMSRVVSLHIQLLVRSSHENLNTDIVPYIYNEITHTPVDKRLRKVFSSTITFRNNIE